MTPVFRFAPSPNGPLHLGHAYSVLLNDHLARHQGGVLLVRMEDIDRARSRVALETAILDDLDWLGIARSGPVRRQSEHMADYAVAAEHLRVAGVLYPCFCGRGAIRRVVAAWEARTSRVWPRDPDGAPHYPGTCREMTAAERAARLTGGEPHGWRLDMVAAIKRAGRPVWPAFDGPGASPVADESDSADPGCWGDTLLLRKDVATSYHLSVVVDDALQGVTHVVRGLDLLRATDLHAMLQRLLGLPTPRYRHHALLLDASGVKLSKSRGSTSLADRRAKGHTPEAIRRELGFSA